MADVRHYQVRYAGLLRDSGGLDGGAVVVLLGTGRFPVGVRRLVDQDVHASDRLDGIPAGFRVAGVGDAHPLDGWSDDLLRPDAVDGLAGLQTSHIRTVLDAQFQSLPVVEPSGSIRGPEYESQGRNPMVGAEAFDGESSDIEPLAAGQLGYLQQIAGLALRGRHGGVHERPYPDRTVDLQRPRPSGQAHRLDEPGQAEDVVSVEVGDQNGPDSHERERRDHQLALGAFAAIHQDDVGAFAQCDAGSRPVPRGDGGRRSEEQQIHQ